MFATLNNCNTYAKNFLKRARNLQSNFQQKYEKRFMKTLIKKKIICPRERGHGTIKFLRALWHPTIGNFDNLYPEWEARDLQNGY